jgi:hypothetical protein
MDRNELPLDLRHLGVLSGVPKMIYEPVVRSFQTVHLCCAEINTISKRTNTSFYMTHVTYEFRQVCPKRFSGQFYVWRKLCTYLASRLELSPKRLKQASI